jgi:hypothetical protein
MAPQYLVRTKKGEIIGPCPAGSVLVLGKLGRLEPSDQYLVTGRDDWMPIEEFYSSSGLDFKTRITKPRGVLELTGMLIVGAIMMAVLGPVRMVLPNPFMVFPIWFALSKASELILGKPVWTMIFTYASLAMKRRPRVNIREALDFFFLIVAIAIGVWRVGKFVQ